MFVSQAMKRGLFTELYSWLILSNNTKRIQSVFESGIPDVVADVVLLENSVCNQSGIIICARFLNFIIFTFIQDYIRITVNSINTTYNVSSFQWEHVQETVRQGRNCFLESLKRNVFTNVFVNSNIQIHLTRVQKICRELGFQKTHFQMESAKDLEGFCVPQTIPGCTI